MGAIASKPELQWLADEACDADSSVQEVLYQKQTASNIGVALSDHHESMMECVKDYQS